MKITAIYNWLDENLERVLDAAGSWKVVKKYMSSATSHVTFRLESGSKTLDISCVVLANGTTTFLCRLMSEVSSRYSTLSDLMAWLRLRLAV